MWNSFFNKNPHRNAWKEKLQHVRRLLHNQLWRQRRQLFSVQWGAAVACCRSPNCTNFYQINFFRASFPRKQGPSLTSEPTYLRAPSGLFRRLFWSFLRTFCAFVVVVVVVVSLKNEFEVRLSSVFFLLPRPLKYSLNFNWCSFFQKVGVVFY